MPETVLQPDFALVDGKLRSGVAVTIDERGSIADVGPVREGVTPVRLANRVLLPGFANVHSHAFQRAIRGRTEWRNRSRPKDDFWTWREQMYAAALRLGPEDVEAVSRMAFTEMALAGFTIVGEFHYLHHTPDGTPYADPDELARRVAAAAQAAGLELVLLRVGYARAGFEREPDPRQRRFIDRTPEDVIAALQRLSASGLSVGVAPHSVRAQPLDWIRTLGRYARETRLPLHMHVAEQPRELAECRAEHGVSPAALLDREGLLDARFTAVHGVHLQADEILALGAAGATVCACPTTERNLGDGVVPARELLAAGAHIAVGTDSQCQVAPLEDVRQLEYHQRLTMMERAVLGAVVGDPDPSAIAARLLTCATENGARALGIPGGSLRRGLPAHLVAIDLSDPSVCGATEDTLLPAIVFGAERSAIRDVWISGRHMVQDGRHVTQDEAVRGFEAAMKRLWS